MANRTGKTEMGVMEDVRCALGENPHWPNLPVPNIGWVLSVSNEAQREILQPKFEKYLPKGRIKFIRQRRGGVWDQVLLDNGSVIGFKSAEMGREVLQGTAIHWAHYDEEPPQDIRDEVQMRLTDFRGREWFTLTPINGMTWIYDRFVDKETCVNDVEVFTASMWDNAISCGGYIPDDEIKRQEEAIPDPIMREIRIYGAFKDQVGRVYKSWDPNVHGLEQLPPNLQNPDGTLNANMDTYCRIDTGRCFAAGFYVVDYLGNVFKFEEYYAEDRPFSENCRSVLNICSQYGIWPEFKHDPTSQFMVDMSENGIPSGPADHDVDKGIAIVNEYLQYNPNKSRGPMFSNPRYYVVKSKCKETMKEYPRYIWEAPSKTGQAIGEKKNKPRKKDDHMMDADRYLLVDRLDPSKPPPGEDDQRPIEMRIRDRVKEKIKSRYKPNREGTTSEDGLGFSDY